jgi:hypothetical protein
MSAVLVSLLVVGAGLGAILRPVSEASVVPAEGFRSVVSGGRPVVGAADSGVGGAIPGAVVPVSSWRNGPWNGGSSAQC